MVEMLVAMEQELHVGQSEPEEPDVVGDEVGALFRTGIDQDVAFGPVIRIAEMPQVPTR